jgi:glycosyltransferase involved in cell wall biosynthesis
LFARKAEAIVTVSEFSKSDIVKCYGVLSEKVHVVNNAAQSVYRVLSYSERLEVRNRWTQGAPYFVFISSIHPRKNLIRLLKAYDDFRSQTGSNAKLVAVGRRFWKNQALDETLQAMKFSSDVIFTGHLDIQVLSEVLGAAHALVYVSYFEGFGVPIVEAFQCGVPVITSNVTSMPEVAGDAALLVNPFDESEIAQAMIRMDSDENLRTELTQRGLNRVKNFDWDSSAKDFWKVVEHIMPHG